MQHTLTANYLTGLLTFTHTHTHTYTHIRRSISLNTIVISITSLSFWAADSAADYCDAQMNLLTLPAPVWKINK